MKISQDINKFQLSRIKPYSSILSLIGEGEENAIHRHDISRITGIPERYTRKHIETIRRSGIVVCASEAGYFYPVNTFELIEYINLMEQHSRSVCNTLNSARALLISVPSEGDGNE